MGSRFPPDSGDLPKALGLTGDWILLETYGSVDALPDDAAGLWDSAGTLFGSRLWWRAVVSTALPSGGEPIFLLGRLAAPLAG